jgi:hypothetical protein
VATLEAVRGRRVRRHPVETIILPTPPDLTGMNDEASSSDDESDDGIEGDERATSDDVSDDVSDNASGADDGSAGGHTASRPGSAISNGETEVSIEPDFSFEYETVL